MWQKLKPQLTPSKNKITDKCTEKCKQNVINKMLKLANLLTYNIYSVCTKDYYVFVYINTLLIHRRIDDLSLSTLHTNEFI